MRCRRVRGRRGRHRADAASSGPDALRSRPASGGRSSGRTARARRRCSGSRARCGSPRAGVVRILGAAGRADGPPGAARTDRPRRSRDRRPRAVIARRRRGRALGQAAARRCRGCSSLRRGRPSPRAASCSSGSGARICADQSLAACSQGERQRRAPRPRALRPARAAAARRARGRARPPRARGADPLARARRGARPGPDDPRDAPRRGNPRDDHPRRTPSRRGRRSPPGRSTTSSWTTPSRGASGCRCASPRSARALVGRAAAMTSSSAAACTRSRRLGGHSRRPGGPRPRLRGGGDTDRGVRDVDDAGSGDRRSSAMPPTSNGSATSRS